MKFSFPLLEDKQLLSFLCLRTSKTLSLGVFDECKTHLCFEFISHAILSILYLYSRKTHNISSKLGFFQDFLLKASDLIRKDAK